MRQDQYESMQKLADKLLDVFIREADPDNWPGKGIELGAMDQQTRGDVYWCRKTAAAVLMLETRVSARIESLQAGGLGTTPAAPGESTPEDDGAKQLDDEIQKAEKEAAKLMRELRGGNGKKAFDKRVHVSRS